VIGTLKTLIATIHKYMVNTVSLKYFISVPY
jgi:hypothetical protein